MRKSGAEYRRRQRRWKRFQRRKSWTWNEL